MKKLKVYLFKTLVWEKEFDNMEEYFASYDKALEYAIVHNSGFLHALLNVLENNQSTDLSNISKIYNEEKCRVESEDCNG